MRTLAESLVDYPLPLLRGIAETRGVALVGEPRLAVEQLAAALSDAESVARAVRELSEPAQTALARLVAARGRMTVAAFTRLAGTIRAFGPGRLAREEPWREPVSAAEELWYRALIARAFASTEQGATEFVYVPTDILPLLPPLPDVALPAISISPIPPPTHVRPERDALLEDACTLLIFVQAHAPWVRPAPSALAGDVSAWRERELTALRALLWEPAALPLLLYLGGRLGWFKLDEGRLRLETRAAREWLEGTRRAQRRALFSIWREASDWNDLRHVPGLRCVETGWRNDPLLARRAILGHLARCAEGWYRLDAFVQAIRETDPDFQRPDGDYNSWYIQDEATGRYLRGFSDWPQVEGALIAHLLTGPLHGMGLIRLGFAGEGDVAPIAFSLSPTGAWLLGLGPEPDEPESARLQVNEDFTILVPAGARLLDRFRVARFATLLSAGSPSGAAGWRYRLSRESLAHAQRQGLAPARILSFLQEASGGQVPRRVAAALTHAATTPPRRPETPPAPRRLWLRRLTILQAEPALWQELRGRTELAHLLGEEIAPGIVAVDEKNLPALRTALHRLGYAVLTR